MSNTKWYQKPIYLLLALALVLSLGIVAVPMVGTVEAASGTIQVDVNDPGCVNASGQLDPYSVVYCSIQDAIVDATTGDVINVAAGTYYESITLKDGVQVLGAGADVTTIDGSTARGGQPAYHVVVGADNATLDGFTVTGGNANGTGNDRCGGGMYNKYSSSPAVTNCIFSGNSAFIGGGMYNSNWSSPTVANCIFSGNSAYYSGGGMSNYYNSSPTVTNCIFSGNSATSNGGGMNNWSSSSPTVANCIFEGNSATTAGGGGMYNEWYCSPTVTNCIFEGNSAYSGGGGIFSRDSSSPTLTSCIFEGNSAGNSGGGMSNQNKSSPKVTNCIFSGNSAGYGAGMYNVASSPTVTNCIFSGNSAGNGGGMYNWESSPTVTNCIFSGNSAGRGGGMSNYYNSSPTVTNCILWRNRQEIYNLGSMPVVTYCDIEGGYPGVGNIDTDPVFVNPPAHDYHSKPGSPCIDAGTNVGAPTEDIEGNPRPIDGDGDGWAITDMGAYEYVPPRPPAHFRYLHSTSGLFNLTAPVGTQWHELWPIFCREYHLSSWEDNGDGILSYCDRIDMYQKPDGEVKPYHVENVTITLYLTPETMGGPMYIELEGGYNASVLTNPVGTQWHQIYPVLAMQYQLSSWNDTDEMGKLDPCDDILLTPKDFYGPLACPLDEDFSGAWPPSGWVTDKWKQSNTNYAGGTPPEAYLSWVDISGGNYSYLDSKAVDTTGLPCLTLEFKSRITDNVDFCPDHLPFDCRVYTRAHVGDSWTDVTPWSNPIYGSVPANTYSLDISSDIGSATQVRFEFDGDSSCRPNSWYVDDVRICYPEPTWWHVEDVAIDIIVTIEPPPVGGEAYPVNKVSLLAPWIAVAVLLAGGISWLTLRRRRAQS